LHLSKSICVAISKRIWRHILLSYRNLLGTMGQIHPLEAFLRKLSNSFHALQVNGASKSCVFMKLKHSIELETYGSNFVYLGGYGCGRLLY